MSNIENPKESLSIKKILSQLISIYKSKFPAIIAIALIQHSVFMAIYPISKSYTAFAAIGIPLSIFGCIFMFWGHAALINYIFNITSNSPKSIKQSFSETQKKTAKFAGASLFVFFLSLCGFLALIIPGLYFGTIFSLVATIVILTDMSLFDAMKKSKALISDNFWTVFILGTLFTLLLWTPALGTKYMPSKELQVLTTQILRFFIQPMGVVLNVLVYSKLKQIKQQQVDLATEGKKNSGIGCLAGIALCVLACFMFAFWVGQLKNLGKTDTGLKVYDFIGKTFAPPINFDEIKTFKRPKNYIILEQTRPNQKVFIFRGFVDREPFKFFALSMPLKDLKINDTKSFESNKDIIWQKYYDYLLNTATSEPSRLPDSINKESTLVTVADNQWAIQSFEPKHEKNTQWVYQYTTTENNLIVFTYGYNNLESNDLKAEEINRIISTIEFE